MVQPFLELIFRITTLTTMAERVHLFTTQILLHTAPDLLRAIPNTFHATRKLLKISISPLLTVLERILKYLKYFTETKRDINLTILEFNRTARNIRIARNVFGILELCEMHY